MTYSRVMMPLTATKKCLADAIKLADEHKYYEANLSLKAAEDGVIVDSVSLADTPQDKSEPKDQTKKGSPVVKNEEKKKYALLAGQTLVDGPWMHAEAIDGCLSRRNHRSSAILLA